MLSLKLTCDWSGSKASLCSEKRGNSDDLSEERAYTHEDQPEP